MLAWVIHRIAGRGELQALGSLLATADSAWLLTAALLSTFGVGLGVLRFRVLLEASDLSLPLGWLTRITLEGRFVGAFTPSTAGLDVYRAIAVGRRTRDKGVATSVVLIEKLVGLLALATLAGGLLSLGSTLLDGRGLTLTFGLGLACALGLFLVLRPQALVALLPRLPAALSRHLEPVVEAFQERRPSGKALFAAFGLSLGSHVLTAAVFLATSRALGLEIGNVALLSLGVALVLSALLPISVGGIGVREGVAVMLLGSLGVAAPQAALVATLGWLLTQPPALLGGLSSLIREADEAGETDPVGALAYATSPGSLAAPPN